MNLHFITSVSPTYWETIGKRCIDSWQLPGQVTVYVDQQQGDLAWLHQVPHNKTLLAVPALSIEPFASNAKVRKFWGKASAQLHAVKHRQPDERVIWLDADVEQLQPVDAELFDFEFEDAVAALNSGHINDSWETGLVIFNQQCGKLDQFMRHYERSWNSEDVLPKLWKPYDAHVLGHTAIERGYFNLCTEPCANKTAIEHSRYSAYFKHWISKAYKTDSV